MRSLRGKPHPYPSLLFADNPISQAIIPKIMKLQEWGVKRKSHYHLRSCFSLSKAIWEELDSISCKGRQQLARSKVYRRAEYALSRLKDGEKSFVCLGLFKWIRMSWPLCLVQQPPLLSSQGHFVIAIIGALCS